MMIPLSANQYLMPMLIASRESVTKRFQDFMLKRCKTLMRPNATKWEISTNFGLFPGFQCLPIYNE